MDKIQTHTHTITRAHRIASCSLKYEIRDTRVNEEKHETKTRVTEVCACKSLLRWEKKENKKKRALRGDELGERRASNWACWTRTRDEAGKVFDAAAANSQACTHIHTKWEWRTSRESIVCVLPGLFVPIAFIPYVEVCSLSFNANCCCIVWEVYWPGAKKFNARSASDNYNNIYKMYVWICNMCNPI